MYCPSGDISGVCEDSPNGRANLPNELENRSLIPEWDRHKALKNCAELVPETFNFPAVSLKSH
jgi:hypothetical protein